MITVYAGTGGEKLGELMPVLAEELGKLTGVVGEDELQRARAQLKVGLVSSLESSGARIEQIGRQMLLFGRPLDIDEVLAAVDRSEEHTSELQSLMRISYAVFCLQKKTTKT